MPGAHVNSKAEHKHGGGRHVAQAASAAAPSTVQSAACRTAHVTRIHSLKLWNKRQQHSLALQAAAAVRTGGRTLT